jgi:predicted DNA-binding protein with PD1-like motif
MNMLPLRLVPGDDLRLAIEAAVRNEFPNGAFVVCGIGSLSKVQLRLAGASTNASRDGLYEIISLSGSVTADGVHLHMSIADEHGQVLGGHVSAGCVVRTTVELLLAPVEGVRLSRFLDPATGFPELNIERGPFGPSLD